MHPQRSGYPAPRDGPSRLFVDRQPPVLVREGTLARKRCHPIVIFEFGAARSGLPDFRRIVPSWGETTHIQVRDCSLSSRVHAGIEPSGKPGQYCSIVRFIFHLREGRSLCKDKAIVPFFAQHCLGSKKLTKCRCGTVT